MSNVYVVSNQQGLFANKHKEWTDGREPKQLFRTAHKDEALNLVFELSSKDIYLRAEAISVEIDEKKQPIVEVTAELPVVQEDEADTLEETDTVSNNNTEQETLSTETATQ